MTADYSVAIVGGGPVGLGLATDLGLRGVPCALIERRTSPQPIPKGQNLTQRTMEHFRFWGIEDDVRRARVMPPGFPTAGLTAYGNLLSGYSYEWWRRDQVGDYYFAANERIPQYETEAVLRARVAGITEVDAHYGATVTSLEATGEAMTIRIDGPAEAPGELTATYVVGCDGARSMVRAAAGIREDRSDHDRRMVLLVFRSAELHRMLAGYEEVSFFRILHPDLDGYWRFLGRVDPVEKWFFHAPVPPQITDRPEDVAGVLYESVGASFDVEFDHVGFWDLRIATAAGYRKGRVFIAGDAAHSHPPYGGYGVNTGLEDARNLAWKLAARVHGWGSDGLLESYETERRPVFVSTAQDFIESFIAADRAFLRAHHPDVDRDGFETAWATRGSGADRGVRSFAPHYEGSPLVWGPPGATSSAVGTHDFAARAGHHLAPQLLASGADLFTGLGSWFALLDLEHDDAAVRGFEGAAANLGVPLRVVRDRLAVDQPGYGAALVLVRPDHFVAWTGDAAPADASAILARAVARSG